MFPCVLLYFVESSCVMICCLSIMLCYDWVFSVLLDSILLCCMNCRVMRLFYGMCSITLRHDLLHCTVLGDCPLCISCCTVLFCSITLYIVMPYHVMFYLFVV